jgi:DNA-binding ferritin-like protein
MDLVAARINVLGGVVQGTIRTAATQSTMPEYPGDLVTGDAYVLAVTERVAHYAAAIRAALKYGYECRGWGHDAHLHQHLVQD